MNLEILFIGLDVDDKAFHGYAVTQTGDFTAAFSCKPNSGALRKKLSQFIEKGYQVQICYEATYIGFSLQRELSKSGYHCDVIAPSLVPKAPGDHVKTDRLDSRKLATYYKGGLLVKVHVPDEEEESIRDLIRARKKISDQQKSIKNSINALCRRLGRNYRQEVDKKTASYWTILHYRWLDQIVKESEHPALKFNLSMQLIHLKQTQNLVDSYEAEIAKISQSTRYQKSVQALGCYRGIDILTAMSMIIELGDINRFKHPKQLTSYAGMDLREYSSGGKMNRSSMTKAGNRHLRTQAIEACQQVTLTPKVGRNLKARCKGLDAQLIEIGERCMLRLHKKSTKLLFRGKPINKIKTACARELLCFVWESLKKAQALAS